MLCPLPEGLEQINSLIRTASQILQTIPATTTNSMQSFVYIDFVRQVRTDAIWRFFLIISEFASDKVELPEGNRHQLVSKGHSTQTKDLGATRPYSVCAHSRSCQKWTGKAMTHISRMVVLPRLATTLLKETAVAQTEK